MKQHASTQTLCLHTYSGSDTATPTRRTRKATRRSAKTERSSAKWLVSFTFSAPATPRVCIYIESRIEMQPTLHPQVHIHEKGTFVAFMQHFTSLVTKYIPHRFCLFQQRRSRDELEKNMLSVSYSPSLFFSAIDHCFAYYSLLHRLFSASHFDRRLKPQAWDVAP